MAVGIAPRRIVGGLLIAIAAACLFASLGAQTPSNTIYACFHETTGNVRVVPPGTECRPPESPIQWSITGPVGPAGPQGPPGESVSPVTLSVDCGTGQAVGAALAQAASRRSVTIVITGVCRETINIGRDDVTLVGASPGDGVEAPDPNANVAFVAGGQRVMFRQITLRGGRAGLLVTDGAAVSGENLVITGAWNAIRLWDGTVRLRSSTIEDSGGTNISVSPAGHLFLQSSTVRNAGSMGIDVTGASAELEDATVEGNAFSGLIGLAGAHLRVQRSHVTGNHQSGIWLHGSNLRMDDSVIAANQPVGIGSAGGTIELMRTTIENNGGGIQASVGSRIILATGTIIRGNGEGIWVGDTSVIVADAATGQIAITENSGSGVSCESAAPAVAQISRGPGRVGFSLGATEVFGNGGEQINCPGIIIR